MELPHYKDLEWRLDVRTGSRSLLLQVDPTIVLRLQTKHEGMHINTYIYTLISHMRESA